MVNKEGEREDWKAYRLVDFTRANRVKHMGTLFEVDPRHPNKICFDRQLALWIETLLIEIVAILRNSYCLFHKMRSLFSNKPVLNYLFQYKLTLASHLLKAKLVCLPVVDYLTFIVDRNTLTRGGKTVNTNILIPNHSQSPLAYHKTVMDLAKRVIYRLKIFPFYIIKARKRKITVKVKIILWENT